MTGWGKRVEFTTPSAMFDREPKPFDDAMYRRPLRMLRMIAILHGLGFQGLRIHPYIYPLGYRVELFPGTHAARDGIRARSELRLEHGGKPQPAALRLATSGGFAPEQLGAPNCAQLSAREMAIKFIEAYPALASGSYYLDYAYAGWFSALLHHCEFGQLPYLYAEYEEELGVLRFHHVEGTDRECHMEYFPLPPTSSAGITLAPMPRPRWMKDE